jgi:ferredoxin
MSFHIDVDPIKCEAHGLCAELLPERITLDEWGYPLIDETPIPASLEALARRTVNACPTLALRLSAAANGRRDGAARPRPSRTRTAG